MTASMHKISAGNGYEYLTRQVAAYDATAKGKEALSDYYSARGEAPGRWLGTGLESLATTPSGVCYVPGELGGEHRIVEAGSAVSAEQMRALFGEGRHPNADLIESAVANAGGSKRQILAAAQLGRKFAVRDDVAAPLHQRLAVAYRDHNLAHGRRWNAEIDADTRADIKTETARSMFTDEHGRAPLNEQELTAFVAQQSRPASTTVAGYDITFSPVKSVSVLWALAPREVSEQVAACHEQAVADAIQWLEQTALFSRMGTHGVQQVDTEGLIAAAFNHRDSRAGDPDIHTHVVVSNKVPVTGPDGIRRWLAVDGTPLHKAIVSISEVYNSRLEAHLTQRLGLSFDEVANKDVRKRPTREVTGIDRGLMESFSKRRENIKAMTGQLAAQFQAAHGREPTTAEAIDLAQQATLATREAKHEPRTHAEQRAAWHQQATGFLGGKHALSRMLTATLNHRGTVRDTTLTVDEVQRYADAVVHTVTTTRSVFQVNHVRAEADRRLRSGVYDPHARRVIAHTFSPAIADQVAEQVVAAVLAHTDTIGLSSTRLDGEMNEPNVLRRRDGSSVYTTARTDTYTTTAVVSAERRILATAAITGAAAVERTDVDLALVEYAANHDGRELNAGQAAMVREMATSGRAVQLTLAPAGTGKTTAMAVLSAAWRSEDRTVIGLAPTATAAAVLATDIGATCDTVDKLVWCTEVLQDQLDHDAARQAGTTETTRARHPYARTDDIPAWFWDITQGSMLIVDEAGMVGTENLDALICYATSKGAVVRLVGDDRQLASISSGGVLRDIAHEYGALTLSQVMRFTDAAEGAASLALREGDHAALGFYADAGRIHVGHDHTAADMAFTAWTHGRGEGKDVVMLAPERETVNGLNQRARAVRLAETGGKVGRTVTLSDGLTASIGDIIVSRENKRNLRLSGTDFVRNGDRWRIREVNRDGSLAVEHVSRAHTTITLPADYVGEHTTLGYACTVHGAQGMTADACHVVGSDMLDRNLLYVAMTRGRAGNHIYLSTAESDPHKITTPKALTPSTAIETLARILDKDGSQQSATSTVRTDRDPALRLARVAAAYDDMIGSLAEAHVGPVVMSTIDTGAEQVRAGLTGQPAWPVLRKHLAILAVAGANPITALTTAAAERELDTALDPAAVLDWRLDPTGQHHLSGGPLPWLPAPPAALTTEPTFAPAILARTARVEELAASVRASALGWTLADAPVWARPYLATPDLLDSDRELVADLAVFRASFGVDPQDRRPAGPQLYVARHRQAQTQLEQRAARIIGHTDALARFQALATELDSAIVGDPFWPELAEHLALASRAGIDVHALARTALAQGGPLPVETPAAALWWRLSGELAPAVLESAGSGVVAAWLPELVDVVGDRATQAITTSPAWPALVAAVNSLDPDQWTPATALATADEMLHAATPDGRIRLDEYATALTWRIDLLGHANPLAREVIALVEEEPLHPELEEQAAATASAGDSPVDGPSRIHTDPGLDEDYQAAYQGDEPPAVAGEPDPVWAGDRDAFDASGLDFSDLSPVNPRAVWTPPVDVATLIADRYEIAAQLREARAERDSLIEAERLGHGAHLVAVNARLTAMRERQDTQRPTAIALVYARERWIEASLDAEVTARQLDTLTNQTSADAESDPATAAALHTTRDRLAAQLPDLRAQAEAAAAEVTAAQAAHELVCAQTGGEVTEADIDLLRNMASDLDWDRINETRTNISALEYRYARIEHWLAHRYAITHTSRTMGQQRDRRAERREFLQADPLRLLTTGELHTHAEYVAEMADQQHRDHARLSRLPARAPSVASEQQQLAEQAAAIRTAQQAHSAVRSAQQHLERLDRDLAATNHQLQAAKRRDRAEIQERVSAQRADIAAARAQLQHARAQAAAASEPSITGHRGAWPAVLARADDHTQLATEYEAAKAADSRLANQINRSRDLIEQHQQQATAAIAEIERRDQLTETELAEEDTIRAEQAPASVPAGNEFGEHSVTHEFDYTRDHSRGPDM